MAHFAYRVDFCGDIRIYASRYPEPIHIPQNRDQKCVVCGKPLPRGCETIVFIARLTRGDTQRCHYACPMHLIGIIPEKSREGVT